MSRPSRTHLRRASAYQSDGAKSLPTDESWYEPPGWRLVPEKPTIGWIRRLRAKSSYAQANQAIQLVLDTAPRRAHTTIERDNEAD